MSKNQQKVLKRIVVALLLLIAVSILDALVEMPWILRLALYLVPYLVIGYDILQKAFKGIRNKQVFDENFLMAVATVGAILLGDYSEQTPDLGYYPDYNEGLIKLCQEMGCTFIDNSTIVTDSSENLYEPDGEHVIQDYYPKWLTNMAQIAGLKA